MNKTTILILAAAGALSAGVATAQPYGNAYGYYGHRWDTVAGSVDQREAMLQRSIDRGVASGQLTRGEVWKANQAMRDIERIEYRYKADGYLTAWEARDLDRRLDDVAMQIRADRNDAQRTYGYNTYRYERPYY